MEDIYLWHLDFPEEINFLEAEYITALVKLAEKKLNKKYKKILDIPCGIGRHHKYLRENGFEVYGIDNNEKLIKIAKERNKGYEKYYEIKDMREIDFNEEFDVVLNWFTSFGYFEHEENIDVLKRFYRALKPKGILILEYVHFWPRKLDIIKHEKDFLEIFEYEEGKYTGTLYKIEGKDLKYVMDLRIDLRIYTPSELKKMLEEVGFKILYVFRTRTFVDYKDRLNDYELGREGVRRIAWIVYK